MQRRVSCDPVLANKIGKASTERVPGKVLLLAKREKSGRTGLFLPGTGKLLWRDVIFGAIAAILQA